jgi:acyl-CoA synthetase (AMP-forming)/AMP-acid ligase II
MPGLAFIEAFYACLCAGIIAVPAYPPDPTRLDRSLARLRAIAGNAQLSFVLSTTMITRVVSALAEQAPDLAALPWIATDAIADSEADGWSPTSPASTDVAFLPYTSGSTGNPKGVVISHGNPMANARQLNRSLGPDAGAELVGWLPVFHDMGLIGNVLYTLWLGQTVTLMSPMHFLQRPMRWLKAIDTYRAGTSSAPNFAFGLVARKATPAEIERLDLSCWKNTVCGAEPVRAGTIEAFCQVFAPCGFSPRALFPCYGLAEAALIATGAVAEIPPRVRSYSTEALARGRFEPAAEPMGSTAHVSCGRSVQDQTVLIVDPETLVPCVDGIVGEMWRPSRRSPRCSPPTTRYSVPSTPPMLGGTYGMLETARFPMHVLDGLGCTIGGGTEEIHRNILSSWLTQQHARGTLYRQPDLPEPDGPCFQVRTG